jgi:hypothetical protein
MEMIRSFETQVHTRTTRRYIPEDGNMDKYRCENLKSYIAVSFLKTRIKGEMGGGVL